MTSTAENHKHAVETTAERIAAQFALDGSLLPGGPADIITAIEAEGADERTDPTDWDRRRWTFCDGSAIITDASGWDVGFSEADRPCWCLAAAGHVDDCLDAPALAALLVAQQVDVIAERGEGELGDGRAAYDGWMRTAQQHDDRALVRSLEVVGRSALAAAWDAIVATREG